MIKKNVKGSTSDPDKEFAFKVTLSDTSLNGTYGDLTFTDGVAEFKLKDGESKKATDLPENITYTVTEDDYSAEGYASSSTGNTGTIVAATTSTAEFTNTRYALNLTVKKSVHGYHADTDKAFKITVTMDDKTINGTFGDMTFENGVAVINLKDGESATAVGLPHVGYSVDEADYTSEGYYRVRSKTNKPEHRKGDTYYKTVTVSNKKFRSGKLTVNKTLGGCSPDPDKEFTFHVVVTDPDDEITLNGTFGDMTFKDGEAEFTLKGGESKTAINIPEGFTYVVTEDDYTEDGYEATAIGAEGTIAYHSTSTAEFINRRKALRLYVRKTVWGKDYDPDKAFRITVTLDDKTINGTYGDMNFTNGVAVFALKDGESVTGTDIPYMGYTITEDNYTADGYRRTDHGDYTSKQLPPPVPPKTTPEYPVVLESTDVYNEKFDAGNLTVNKEIAGNFADSSKDFEFTVTLNDTTLDGTFGDLTFEDGVAEFTLKGGESKTATGLPEGTEYKVTEADYTSEGYVTTSNGAEGTIVYNETAVADFLNTKELETGNLTVKKIVTGNAADTSKKFAFTVTLSDKTFNGTFGDMTFKDGVATFTLKGGESITTAGIPAGITYKVTEDDYTSDGYVTTKTGDTGTITSDKTLTAKFTNTKNLYGDLQISKKVTGTAGDKSKYFTFKITFDCEGSYTYIGSHTGKISSGGTVKLKHGESITITGLPVGTKYTVTESDNKSYTVSASGDKGTIKANTVAKVQFTNKMDQKTTSKSSNPQTGDHIQPEDL